MGLRRKAGYHFDKRNMASSKLEVEVKIAVRDLASARKAIRGAGFRVHVPRVLEINDVYDTADERFRTEGKVIRLREAGKLATLTFKGKGIDRRHKTREEIESSMANPDALRRVFQEVGLQLRFRYEKYRTEFTVPGSKGIVTLDETPIGNFIEVEGSPRWIDRTAKALGFGPDDYINLSYGLLYQQFCREMGKPAANMVFKKR